MHATWAKSEASPSRELPPVRVPRTASGRRGGRAPGSRPTGAAWVWPSFLLSSSLRCCFSGPNSLPARVQGRPGTLNPLRSPGLWLEEMRTLTLPQHRAARLGLCISCQVSTPPTPARATCFLAMEVFTSAATRAIVCGYLNPFALLCC